MAGYSVVFVEKRAHVQRDRCAIDASIRLSAPDDVVVCLVTNLTESGAAITLDEQVVLPERFHLAMPVVDDIDHERPVELRWRNGPVAGLRFLAG